MVVAVALVLVIRPVAGYLSFLGHRTQVGTSGLDHRERLVVAFFGVRGVGSIYYVAYAAGAATFPEERWLWSTVGFTVALSVVAPRHPRDPGDAAARRPARRRRA